MAKYKYLHFYCTYTVRVPERAEIVSYNGCDRLKLNGHEWQDDLLLFYSPSNGNVDGDDINKRPCEIKGCEVVVLGDCHITEEKEA